METSKIIDIKTEHITRPILRLRLLYSKVQKFKPHTINQGDCMNFALEIESMGYGQAIWGNDLDISFYSKNVQHIEDWMDIAYGHAFIWYDDKFYDSECPQGCDYPDQLPYFQRELDFMIHSERC